MLIKYLVFNHSGTMIKTFEVQSDIIPRTGEVISIEKMDNTDKFIVTDIIHYPLESIIEITCESFYDDTGLRTFTLSNGGWLPSESFED